MCTLSWALNSSLEKDNSLNTPVLALEWAVSNITITVKSRTLAYV